MQKVRKTPVAAKELGESYHRLINLIRFGKITPPARDSSGDFLWEDKDIANAREAFAHLGRRKNTTAKTAAVTT